MTLQNWILVFHVFGLVLWAGSLLALVRCMTWRVTLPDAMAAKIRPFEKKLMFGGAHVGMGITVLTGIWMLSQQEWGPLIPSVSGGGFHIKLTFVFLLIVVTFIAQMLVMSPQDGAGNTSKKQPKVLYLLTLLALFGVLTSIYVLYPYLKANTVSQPAETSNTTALLERVDG